ncbi:MAG: hypothetical protein V3U29_09935 [Phycisphaeraceae bacterium]
MDLQTALAQPVNDNCADAIAIFDGSTSYNTTGANTDGPDHGSCQFDGQTYSDIWYEYLASCTGELIVSTCNSASYDTDLVVYDGCDCGNLSLLGCNDDAGGCAGFTSEVTVNVVENNCYLVRVGGWQSGDQGSGTVTLTCIEEGEIVGACCVDDQCLGIMTLDECAAIENSEFHENILSCVPDPCTFGAGPDVIYQNATSIQNFGSVGGIRGYILDSFTCNVGNMDLLWGNAHDGTPVLAMNAYRLHEGRLEQIGMSWVKHACCAAAGSGCGLACNGNGGSVLGVGCRDVYSTGWNGNQDRLGPRSDINAFSGDLLPAPGGSGNAIFKRLQVRETDLTQSGSGALYFVEGVYVGSDDAAFGNWLNNASYRRVTVGSNFNLSPTGSMEMTVPAIFAWLDHGNGANTPDPTVQIVEVDVPGEGRFYLATKVTDLGGNAWRYAYALYNLNSHRSGGSFSVPIPVNVDVENVGFNDVDYHSGEVYGNTDWNRAFDAQSVTWSSPRPFDQDPNSNALRWATMYTFWFEANTPPQDAEVTIGLFRPGKPDTVTAMSQAPSPGKIDCPADLDGDGSVGAADLANLLGAWGPNPGHPADFNGDDVVGPFDLAILLGAWGPCP